MRGWPIRLLLTSGIVAVLFFSVIAFHDPLLRAGIDAAGRTQGYHVTFGHVGRRDGRWIIDRPDVASLHGEPVFTAERIGVAFDPRQIFGGPYLYGISGLEIDRPKITVIHHRDGTYNFVIPTNNGTASSKPFVIPRIHVVVRDGSLGVLDETKIFRHSRKFAIEALQLDADLVPKNRSTFTLGLAVLEDGGKFPFAGRGTFDEGRGFELARVRAKSLAIAPLLDYAINSTSLHFAYGVLDDVDARVYGLLDRTGTMQRHVSITANLDHFQPYLNGIAKPLRDGRGALRVYDQGLAIPKVDGSIANIPVRIAGAIYDLSKPKLRLGIAGNGDLHGLLTLSDAAKKLPLAGPLAFRLLVVGDATAPTTFLGFASPRLAYARIPLDRPSGTIALSGQNASILRSHVGYGGADAGARGNLVLAKHTGVELVANLAAPASRIPYARQLLGDMTLGGLVVATGVDSNLHTTGFVEGDTVARHLAGTFAVNGKGVGTIGPLELDGPGGTSLRARVALDRPSGGGGAAVIAAHAFHIDTTGPQPALPGLALAALPPVTGTLDADVVAQFAGSAFAADGSAHAYGVRALGYPIEDVTARAAVRDAHHIAVVARYRGALAPLAAAAGGKIAATGRVDLPVSIVASSANDAIAQIDGARFDGVRVGGVPVEGLEGTVALRGKAVDVYAARLRLGVNDVVASGSFGNGGTLDVSAGGVDLAALRSLGLPVRTGVVSAVASIGGTTSAPTVAGGVVASGVTLPNPQYAGLPVDASSELAFAGDRLSLRDALVNAGPAVASLDGTVSGLRGNPKAARLAFGAHARQLDLATLAHIAKANLQYPEGSLDADVAVTGTAGAPAIAGGIRIPEGSYNGLRFRSASVALAGGLAGVRARAGTVTVGSSTIGFDADVSQTAQRARLHAPHIDLADLNDYFDRGDTLGGTGSIDVAASNAPNALAASGRVRLAHTRFRRFDIGDTRADLSTRGRDVRIDTTVGSSAGRIAANGVATLAATQPLRDAAHRTTLAFNLRADNVDLDTWLPAAGIQAPVSGFVNATARARGTYPNVAVVAHADLQHGMAQRIPIRTASFDATAANGRATISNAVLAIDNLTATARGSAGLQPNAPVDFTVDANSADVGALAKTVTGTSYGAAGAFRTAARITGTAVRPALSDTLDVDRLVYDRFTLPHAHAQFAVSRTRATLQALEADFKSGRLLADGYAPLVTAPAIAVGPPTAPIVLNLTAERIDLAQFADLLPKGTALTGLIDGRVALGGSLANPGLAGTLALANGTFVGPQLKSKLTNVVAALTFAGRTATLHDTSASVGGGTIVANGRLSVPDLQNPARNASLNLVALANDPYVDAPAYLKGRVNGRLTVVRNPARDFVVGGNLAFSQTRIPTNLLLQGNGPTPTASTAPLPVALALGIDVGNDVRVQGGPVDIGAKGRLQIGGTIGTPTAAGELDSTGGTISFYRTFRLQYPSTLVFDPSNGVIPTVDASATTTVDNPQTDVSLRVTGPATQLNVALASDPNYSREQILGLLVGAQALGAVSGVQTTANSGAAQQNPFQAAAAGQLGTLLTQNVLEPLSSGLGSAVGLNNLELNYSPGGSVGLGAQKKIFKNVNAVFAESFGEPQRQSIGLSASPNDATALQLTFFSQPTSNRFNNFEGANSLQSTNTSVTSAQPANGASGFSFSLQRKFP